MGIVILFLTTPLRKEIQATLQIDVVRAWNIPLRGWWWSGRAVCVVGSEIREAECDIECSFVEAWGGIYLGDYIGVGSARGIECLWVLAIVRYTNQRNSSGVGTAIRRTNGGY
jgi:hypothetical protein